MIVKKGPRVLLGSGAFFIIAGFLLTVADFFIHYPAANSDIRHGTVEEQPIGQSDALEAKQGHEPPVTDRNSGVTGAILHEIETGPWAAFVSAGGIFVGAGIALLGFSSQRQLTRTSATLDLLNRNIWDEDCISARQEFIKLGRKDGGLGAWADASHWDSSQVDAISAILNDYELMAIAVRRGTIDENFFKEFSRGIVRDHWKKAKPFISKLRKDVANKKLYLEFEALANQWRNGQNYEGKTAESVLLNERNRNL